MNALVKTLGQSVPKKYARLVKKVLGMSPTLSITKIYGKDLQSDFDSMEKKVRRKLPVKIITDIKEESLLAVSTQAIDRVIQKKLESGNYNWDEILVIINPYGLTPLSALAVFQTKRPCGVKVVVKGINPKDDITGKLEPVTNHRVPIMGLYADKRNEIRLELYDEKNQLIGKKVVYIKTAPLPESLLDMVNVKQYSGSSAFGLTMVSGKSVPYPFAYDSAGHIRYYLKFRPRGYGLFPMDKDRFLCGDRSELLQTYEIAHPTQLYDMDYFGRQFKIYYVKNGCHHDYNEKTPGGNILVVSSTMDGYYEDMIVEIDRNTGDIVKTLDLRDIFGSTYCDRTDWVHINTISYDESSNSVLISPRNLHSVIKVDWGTNELIWILCDPRFWEGTEYMDKVLKPEGEISWHYQQHAAYELPENLDGYENTRHIILFDNHWHKRRRVDFFDEDTSSYVKIYTIDEQTNTVRLEHSYQGVKSKITSNGLLDFKKRRVFSMGGYLDPLIDERGAMICEYDYDTEKMLNQYSIKNYFFRAYEMKVNYQVLAEPMPKDENYVVGSLQRIELLNTKITVPDMKIPTEVQTDYKIKEDVLYLYTVDHAISHIYLLGNNRDYVQDYSYTTQEQKSIFGTMEYYISIPLNEVEPGSYKLCVNYLGELCDTGKKIRIV